MEQTGRIQIVVAVLHKVRPLTPTLSPEGEREF
jgi:hypothetical protein